MVEGVEEIELEEIESTEPILESIQQPEIISEEVLSRECDGDLYQNIQEEQNVNFPTEEKKYEDIVEEK